MNELLIKITQARLHSKEWFELKGKIDDRRAKDYLFIFGLGFVSPFILLGLGKIIGLLF